MDPDPLRLLETAHPVRSPALLPSSPNSRFRLRPLPPATPPETVNKRVNKIVKNVDGPTQMSRRRARPRFLEDPVCTLSCGSHGCRRALVLTAARDLTGDRGIASLDTATGAMSRVCSTPSDRGSLYILDPKKLATGVNRIPLPAAKAISSWLSQAITE